MMLKREKKSQNKRIRGLHVIIAIVPTIAVLSCFIFQVWNNNPKQMDISKTDNQQIDINKEVNEQAKQMGINKKVNGQNILETSDTYATDDLKAFFTNGYDGEDSLKNMKLSSKATVEKLKSIYNNLQFYDGFDKGDVSVYDYYAEKYTRLLKSKAKFYDPEGEGGYYSLSNFAYDVETLKAGLSYGSIICLMFDMDGDGLPELCLSGVRGAFVFKYIPESDQYVVWWKSISANYQMIGSRKVKTFFLDDFYQFDQLSKSGEDEWTVSLGKPNTENYEERDLVTLPTYKKGFRKDDLIKEMGKDGYYDDRDSEGWGTVYFRVTKAEYLEVTKPFFDAIQQASYDSEKFTFTPNLD